MAFVEEKGDLYMFGKIIIEDRMLIIFIIQNFLLWVTFYM
jgi:hypothetical protein